jgi:hypothetical protein
MLPAGNSENGTVIGPVRIDGGVSRIRRLPSGGSVIESWKPGIGWVEGGASLDEFMPGACTPVSPELAQRMGIPVTDLDASDPWVAAKLA